MYVFFIIQELAHKPDYIFYFIYTSQLETCQSFKVVSETFNPLSLFSAATSEFQNYGGTRYLLT